MAICCLLHYLQLVYSDLPRLLSSAAWVVQPMTDTTHHCHHRQSPFSPLMSMFYSTNASNQTLPIGTRHQQTHAATPTPEANSPMTTELGETHRQNGMKELLLGIRRGDRAKLAVAITLGRLCTSLALDLRLGSHPGPHVHTVSDHALEKSKG